MAEDDGEVCPVTDTPIQVPHAPQSIDPCNTTPGVNNATWQTPAETDQVVYSINELGQLIVKTKPGYVFTDGTHEYNYGYAPDDGQNCLITVVPVAPAQIDECNAVGGGNNAYWPVPADTDAIDWNLTAAGHLTATAKTGYQFSDAGLTFIDFGPAIDDGQVCPPTSVPVPAQPEHIEVCNPPGEGNNSIWIVPESTPEVYWTHIGGILIAYPNPGYVFTDGSTMINFGLAPDNGWPCVPGTA